MISQEQDVIRKILEHLKLWEEPEPHPCPPGGLTVVMRLARLWAPIFATRTGPKTRGSLTVAIPV